MTSEFPELDGLVGHASVKAQIGSIATRLAQERDLRARGLGIFPAKRHLVFSGPAGVGKRKAADIYGAICHRLGALACGHVVNVKQADLGAAGHSEKLALMRDKCKAACDGILYVENEVFLAAGILRSTGDLHLDAVDVMIEFMDKLQRRIVVILDARPNQLQSISFRTGLARRFTQTIDFPAYDAVTLLRILGAAAKDKGFELPEGLDADLLPWIMTSSRRNDWRNAQEMTDLFAKALAACRQRTVQEHCGNLRNLDLRDFKEALLAMPPRGMINAVRPIDIYGTSQAL